MALKKNNDPQKTLIDSLKGIHLVDAGAGTGKTYSIVKRYEKILSAKSKPKDILLITFTVNAAEQMKEKVIEGLYGNDISDLLEAPIMTFHSFCTRILKKSGTNSPSYLGLDEYLSGNFNVLEEKSFEEEIFRKYFLNFSKLNREKYESILDSLEGKHDSVLNIIKKLCSAGIFPSSKGWSEQDKEKLKGNYEEFSENFDKLNAVKNGKKGEVQNKLYNRFDSATKDKLYTDFNSENIFEDNKRINPGIKEEIFSDDLQSEFLNFMNDIYLGYIEYLLQRNQINFEFMVMFAYLVLYKNESLRKKNQFEYVMIDEFQDTDEIQFKIILLVCKNINGSVNLCAVGDWKQGIYSFRNTQIENITEFKERIKLYKEELNKDIIRIEYDVEDQINITFKNNYRSSESILKFSRKTLLTKGSADDEVDSEFVDENFKDVLDAERSLEDFTEIKFLEAKDRADEYQLVLKIISQLVNEKEKYKIRVFDNATGKIKEERPVKYSDICVLSRKKKFCLEFQREAMIAGIPVNYSGGLEIFSSEQGVLVLAWLKLLLNESDISGWLPVLDKEGYSYSEIKYFKEKIIGKFGSEKKLFSEIPVGLSEFLNRLKTYRSNILFAVEAILGKYNFHDETGNKIITVLQQWNDADLVSLNELVRIIEKSANSYYETELGNTADAVLTQTIHKSKGLEYPVVILSDVNSGSFPGNKGETGKILFNHVIGLRAKTFFGTNGKYYYNYNNWKTDLLSAVTKKSDYDEERRLLYVAATRAKQYLYFTAFKPSMFFRQLAEISEKAAEKDFEYEINYFSSEESTRDTEIKLKPETRVIKKFISTHKMMEEIDGVYDQTNAEERKLPFNFNKKKLEFGVMIHNLAAKIAAGINVESEITEVQRIKSYISGLNASELRAEADFLFPEGETVMRGVMDLIAFYDDRIEVTDYKTDSDLKNLEKYKIQISAYKKVLESIYPEKKVTGKIYFVSIDKIIVI
jgi:superfamily I DNA/RNA helicase